MSGENFCTSILPEEGYYSEAEYNWLLRPSSEWEVRGSGAWLDVGGPGVDGISFTLRRREEGIFAYYPIEREFVWKAKDGESLVAGWLAGTIKV